MDDERWLEGPFDWILLDAGMVLTYPASGDWFFPAAYDRYCARAGLKVKPADFGEYFVRAYEFLDANHLVRTIDEEYAQFLEFYRILFEHPGLAGHADALVEECARELVHSNSKFAFYDDVKPGLASLRSNYRLGVLSDTWPSLERVFRDTGLHGFFDVFVMSSVHGTTKVEGLLFDIALAQMKADPARVLFVDDSNANLLVARAKGYACLRMNRFSRESGIKKIREFVETPSLWALAQALAK